MGENKGNRTIAIGLMLFALFFGAGNLIFPAAMGQAAGSNVWWAVLGFVVTGVGLPLAGVLAMGYSGCKNLQELAGRVTVDDTLSDASASPVQNKVIFAALAKKQDVQRVTFVINDTDGGLDAIVAD